VEDAPRKIDAHAFANAAEATSSPARTSTGGDRPGLRGNLADGADVRPRTTEAVEGRFRRPRRRSTPDGVGTHNRGLSREHIMASIDASLDPAGTDHVDLYQIPGWTTRHRSRRSCAPCTRCCRPAMCATWVRPACMPGSPPRRSTSPGAGWTRFASMQNHDNLVCREEKREMIPLRVDQGTGPFPGVRWRARCSPVPVRVRAAHHQPRGRGGRGRRIRGQ
jgi:1-deoxyxylulose-5-phosphate synthase